MGGAMSKPAASFFTLVGGTSIAYCHDVMRENLTFWLFQYYVKSDLIANSMKLTMICAIKNLLLD